MKRDHYKTIAFGIVVGVVFFIRPFLFGLSLFSCLLYLLSYKISGEHYKTLFKIVTVGLLLRLTFCFVASFYLSVMYLYASHHPFLMHVIGNSMQLFRDFHREYLNGLNLYNFYIHNPDSMSFEQARSTIAYEGRLTYLHAGALLQSFLHLLFGPSILNILIFSAIGSFIIPLTYLIAKNFLSEKNGLIAAGMVAVFPSLIIWSNINIRMTLGIISFLMAMYAVLQFKKQNKIHYLPLLLASIVLLDIAKDKFTKSMMLIVGLFLFIGLSCRPKLKILMISVIIILSFWMHLDQKVRHFIFSSRMDILSTQVGYSIDPSGNNYKIYKNYVYNYLDYHKFIPAVEMISAIPKAIYYFLFSPFPWNSHTTLRLLAYPQSILWYFCVFFALMGFWISLRYRFTETVFLFIFLAYWIILMALTIGNEGTAARQRDLIVPFFFIFSSLGITKLLTFSETWYGHKE